MKKRSKVIAGSVLTMAMCASLATGATFALFTSESSVNVAVTSAKVNVSAKVDDTTIVTATDSSMAPNQAFKAEYKNGTLQVVNMAAGDSVKFDIGKIPHHSFRTRFRCERRNVQFAVRRSGRNVRRRGYPLQRRSARFELGGICRRYGRRGQAHEYENDSRNGISSRRIEGVGRGVHLYLRGRGGSGQRDDFGRYDSFG